MPVGKTWFQNAFRAMGARAGLGDLKGLKARTVRKTLGDALRFAPQRFMKGMIPMMMMMSMMPVMMSQVTQMAARHVAHLCRGRRVRANTSRAEKQRFRGSHALLMQKAPRGFLLVQ